MFKGSPLQIIEETGVIAIVRLDQSEELINVAKAIADGGVRAIEFTMTITNALEVISDTSKKFGNEILLGAGTVLDAETARAAILAGAEFIVSPTLKREVIEICKRYSKLVIPGGYTPTEILNAWEYGADIVKVFPAEIGGPKYIKALKAPLPQIKLVPVGGVSIENTGEFIRAGATAIAVGSNLVDKKLVKEKKFRELTTIAGEFILAVHKGRETKQASD